MKICYQCNRSVGALSSRSRCIYCEQARAEYNEAENDMLRETIEKLQKQLKEVKDEKKRS